MTPTCALRLTGLTTLMSAAAIQAAENLPVAAESAAAAASLLSDRGLIGLAAGLAITAACFAAALAVGRVGAAAIGVLAEKPELLGRVLILVGLAEGIAIYGLIVAIMLLGKM